MTAASSNRPLALAGVAVERSGMLLLLPLAARGPAQAQARSSCDSDIGARHGHDPRFGTMLVFLVVMLALWLRLGVTIQ